MSPLDPQELVSVFAQVRSATEALAAPLSAEDQMVQSMSACSPTKWHLGHTTWYFETFVLAPHLPGYQRVFAAADRLWNSYYETVATPRDRTLRHTLSRPSLAEVQAFRRHVDGQIKRLCAAEPSQQVMELIQLGINHEEQHQELILTDIKHAFSLQPLRPAYHGAVAGAVPAGAAAGFRCGRGRSGLDGAGGIRFQLRQRAPATSGRCSRTSSSPTAWSPAANTGNSWPTAVTVAPNCGCPTAGRRRRRAAGKRRCTGSGRTDKRTGRTGISPCRECAKYLPTSRSVTSATTRPTPMLGGPARVCPARPSGNEPPTNSRSRATCWKLAACIRPPALVDQGDPAFVQLFGDVWEWTGSPYVAYPGYRRAEGALGEYNGKFMCNQLVLRGGSCVTPRRHLRSSYRNFFPPDTRWQFSGIRLARDGRSE